MAKLKKKLFGYLKSKNMVKSDKDEKEGRSILSNFESGRGAAGWSPQSATLRWLHPS